MYVDGYGREDRVSDGSSVSSDSILVFIESDILDPVKSVLDSPMSPDSLLKDFGRDLKQIRDVK